MIVHYTKSEVAIPIGIAYAVFFETAVFQNIDSNILKLLKAKNSKVKF